MLNDCAEEAQVVLDQTPELIITGFSSFVIDPFPVFEDFSEKWLLAGLAVLFVFLSDLCCQDSNEDLLEFRGYILIENLWAAQNL